MGISHGANQALILEKMQNEGKLSFKVNAIQAYSPAVSMFETMDIFDGAITKMNSVEVLREECILSKLYWKFYNLKREYPVKKIYDSREMMIAIARIFHMDLVSIALKNDDLYGDELVKAGKKRLLPIRDSMNREDLPNDDRRNYAEVLTFSNYLQNMVIPYWELKGTMPVFNFSFGGGDGEESIFDAGFLTHILKKCGKNVDVILTVNDPLSGYSMCEFLKENNYKNVTLLSRGGHLGYANSKWTKARILSIFDGVPPQQIVPNRPKNLDSKVTECDIFHSFLLFQKIAEVEHDISRLLLFPPNLLF